MRLWLHANRRIIYGRYDRLLDELRMEDQQLFFTVLMILPTMFYGLMNRVGCRITKDDTTAGKHWHRA